MNLRAAVLLVALVTPALAGCPGDQFGGVAPVLPDFDAGTATTATFDTSSPTGTGTFTGGFDTGIAPDTSGTGGYYDDLRQRVAGCVRCHGASGPAEPPLHSFVALRNAVDPAIRALDNDHDGNYSRLAPDCDIASDASLVDLATALRRWRDDGFPNGTITPPPGQPDPREDPTATLTVAKWAKLPGARCYVLGAIPAPGDGGLGTIRVNAERLAWVELYAMAPGFEAERAAREAADPAPGWACDADLELVPQPMVAFWSLGDGDIDYRTAPLRTAPGATLVARVESLESAVPSIVAEPNPPDPTLSVELWNDLPSGDWTTFVPLHTDAASTAIAWRGGGTSLVAVASGQDVELLQRDREAERGQCLQTRFCTSDPCDPPPLWPGQSKRPTGDALFAGDRLSLRCADDGPCDAQLRIAGPFDGPPCGAAAKTCAAACAGDLACIEGCAAADVSFDADPEPPASSTNDRCALCVLTGQLACRAATCDAPVEQAWSLVESCASAEDPGVCIHDSVFIPLGACPASDLCAPALAACGLE